MKQPTAITADKIMVVLNCLVTPMAVRAGNTIRLEIRRVPIILMPRTTVTAVRMAIITLYFRESVPVAEARFRRR